MLIDQDFNASQASGSGGGFLHGEVIVRLSESPFNREALAALRESVGAELVSSTVKWGFELWRFAGAGTEAAIATLQDSGIAQYAEYVQANHTLSAAEIQAEAVFPNDANFPNLWGLHNTGQGNGTPDADIDAPEAWDVSTGAGVVVGVIDSGVDYNHPDLINQMWINPGEIAGNGIDDDNNGYVDDIFGYDFANDDGDPWDDDSHGTHVAGTIAAQANNGIGVSGVAYNAEIMALKFLDANGTGSTFDAIRAVEYATLMGADLTNNSWGGGGFSQALYDAIELAGQAGQLFIAAAGNGGSDQIGDNNDLTPHYPSNYDLDNIISVAATDRNDNLTSFSNFGATSVDLAAPGSGIFSTIPGGSYAWFSGTSMATPHVAGAVALLLASEPNLSPAQAKARILDSVDPLAGLDGITVTGGRLNAAAALAPPAPGSISGLVWNDSDNDGVRDAGEGGLSGWTVYIDANGNGVLDSGEATDTTDTAGQYSFANVTPGVYEVRQVVQSGWTQTAPLFSGSYVWSDSNDVGGPAFDWFDIATLGTQVTLADDASVTTALPFTFDYYGQQHTSVAISSNGYLTFGSNGTDFSNDPIPSATDPDAIIAPFWDDLNPVNGGNIYYYNDAANSRFIVQYEAIRAFSGSGTYSFQAILNADGTIGFQYESMAGTLNSATIGIENHAGDDGLQIAFNSNYVQNGLAVLIEQAAGQPTFNQVTVGSGQAVTGADFGNHNPAGADPSPGNDNLIGTGGNDTMLGWGGNDTFLLRFGDDTATGGTGADQFNIDGRYINNGDAHRITDLTFGEGDTLVFRLFAANSFSNGADPTNILTVADNGGTATFDSTADIVEAHLNGVMQASDAGDGDTLLTISKNGAQVSVELDGISFAGLGIGGGADPSPGNDNLVGTSGNDTMLGWGGNDTFLLRFGDDTATGGTGADQFNIDGRYIDNGDAHRITDLTFAEGDTLVFRLFAANSFSNGADPTNTLTVADNGGTATFDSIADIVEAHLHGVMQASDAGDGDTLLTISNAGEQVSVELDGISFAGLGIGGNTPPVARDDSFNVAEDTVLTGDLLADNGSGIDYDPEAGAVSITAINGIAVTDGEVVTLGSGALLTINADGTFTYDQNNAFASLNDGDTGNDSFTYTLQDDQSATGQATVSIAIAGTGGPVDPSPGNDSFVGTGADNIFSGYGGNDSFLLRWGDDTATGGAGADVFTIDGRYVNAGDDHRITDLNFSEGDVIDFRFMDAGTFDNNVDPTNYLFVYDNGAKAQFNSVADILEAHNNGVMTAADDGFGGTILSVSVGGDQLTITLDGWDII